MGHISRASYYKWINHKESDNDKLNQKLAERLEKEPKAPKGNLKKEINEQIEMQEVIFLNKQISVI